MIDLISKDKNYYDCLRERVQRSCKSSGGKLQTDF